MNNKPGVKTSEFWVTAVTQIIGVLAVSGIFTPQQADVLTDVIGQGEELVNQNLPIIQDLVTRVIGLITMLGTSFGYAQSRAKTKMKGGE